MNEQRRLHSAAAHNHNSRHTNLSDRLGEEPSVDEKARWVIQVDRAVRRRHLASAGEVPSVRELLPEHLLELLEPVRKAA
jgi:hypothetical protein